MKTIHLTRVLASMGMALGLGYGSQAMGDTLTATARQKTMEGVAVSIDPADRTVSVSGFWGNRRVNVADNCTVSQPDKPTATLADLRPGQELKIYYENAQGVLVAHQIAQQKMTFTGHVRAMDTARHTLTLRNHTLDKTFQIAGDCKVLLRNERAGALTDVQTGHRVTVTYETPDGAATARHIAQTSESYSGALTAIDLNDRTLKAKAFLATKKFNVADDCAIILDGKPAARLDDLKLGDRLVFSYDDINGVNVVNRIGTGEPTPEPTTTASGRVNDAGMPVTPPY